MAEASIAAERLSRKFTCSVCGQLEDRPRSGRAKYCRECRVTEQIAAKRRSYARRKGVEVPGPGHKACERCGAPTEKVRSSKKYCAPCKAEVVAASKAASFIRRGRARKSRLVQCGCCGKSVEANSARHRYCEPCVTAAKMLAHSKTSYHYHLRHRLQRLATGQASSCQNCSRTFDQRAVKQRFCSRRCQAQARLSDPAERLNNRMRSSIASELRGQKKRRRWQELVGYSTADLIAHLERQFLPGMTWDNIGTWHIDHRRPLASFTYATAEDPGFKEAWSLSNLQPLWAKDNLSKGAKTVLLL